MALAIHGKSLILAALVGACLMLALLAAPCRAATTITVNDLGDPTSNTNDCTLRDGINLALGNSITPDACATNGTGSPFTITFSVTGTITLGSTLPAIASGTTLTITGPNPLSSSGITIGGKKLVEIMQVNSGATVTLQYLTLTEGVSSAGGAISNQGALTITNCTLSNNRAQGGVGATNGDTGAGGAIVNSGTLTITGSTFSSNQAVGGVGDIDGGNGNGGAIENFATVTNNGMLTITNSTFSTNQATGGAGGTMGGAGQGGAILNSGTLTMTNATFSGNQAFSGGSGGGATGGAIVNDGTANLKGTILAASVPDNCNGTPPVTDNGYNLSDDASCAFSQATSENGASNIGLAAAPADNGGPTETIALTSANSPAVDKIPAAMCPATDQRGVTRPDNGEASCDSGAYEFQDPPPPFAGTPGAANCKGQTVSTLSQQFGTLDAAAAAFGFPSVKALQSAIKSFCAG
jgi:hypothetical protein